MKVELLRDLRAAKALLDEAGAELRAAMAKTAKAATAVQAAATLSLDRCSMAQGKCDARELVLWALKGGPYTIDELVKEFGEFVLPVRPFNQAGTLSNAVRWLYEHGKLVSLQDVRPEPRTVGPVRYRLRAHGE